MSRICLGNLKQHAAAVESCIQDVEPYLLNKYGEASEKSEELRNNWDHPSGAVRNRPDFTHSNVPPAVLRS